MKEFETIILGGGTSGSMCALSSSGKNIAIIDAGSRLVKKLLVTGNGKCNLSNSIIDKNPALYFYNENISDFLSRFTVEQTLSFFQKLGLETCLDEEGRVYPISKSALSVQDVIVREIEKREIAVFLEHEIFGVKKAKGGFEIETNKEVFFCKKLVFALGGNKNNLLQTLGISTKNAVPSLCAVKTQKNRMLSGKRIENVLVSAKDKAGKVFSQRGEVLFKDEGISGIVILSASSLFARQGEYQGEITLDLLPDLSPEELEKMLLNRRSLGVKVSDFFVGLFVNHIGYLVLETAGVAEDKNSRSLTNIEVKALVETIKNLRFQVSGFYDNNQVFSGGVRLSSLDKNLQSKEVQNLFVCGEACDVDGICGGFNLQWAWTSGHIVGSQL